MEFFINKNSTLPKLKMELVNDGRNDFRQFYEKVQNATIKFTMYDVETKIKKIANSTASIQLKDPNCSIGGDKPEYYIVNHCFRKLKKKNIKISLHSVLEAPMKVQSYCKNFYLTLLLTSTILLYLDQIRMNSIQLLSLYWAKRIYTFLPQNL